MRGSVFYTEGRLAAIEHDRSYMIHKKMLDRIKHRPTRSLRISLTGERNKSIQMSTPNKTLEAVVESGLETHETDSTVRTDDLKIMS
jgi:hypothetical protein